jgi:hypothetical protein
MLVVILHSWPPLPSKVRIDVAFPATQPGACEPLIATGEFCNGDFLAVKYEAGDRLTISYDAWGAGGPSSVSIPYIPGERHRLDVEMPSFKELVGESTRPTAPLRVALDGKEIVSGEVTFHRRKDSEIYFGVNPLGGTPAALFRGTLWRDDGAKLQGGPESYFSAKRRLIASLSQPRSLIAALLFGVAFGFMTAAVRRWFCRRQPGRLAEASQTAPHRWFLLAAALCTLAFAYVITGGTFKLLFPESFGVFYDYQALSLLHGRLDVPGEALSGEAFLFDGKCYGYFGPTPALLRIPFAMIGVGFGLLSRPLMVLQFAACLGAVYALLCEAVKIRSGRDAWPSRWATVTFVIAAGLGSTLFYLSSRAYIYHEAILCGAAFGLWACYFTLRYLEAPASRWWIPALICGTLAVHSRPPLGLYALVFTGVAAAINLLWRSKRDGAVRGSVVVHLAAGALAVAGVLSYNGLSYLKFKTIDGCPLRYNVQYNATRLARIDGKQFHLSNISFGFDAYFGKRTIQTTRHFPYFAPKGLDSRHYPRAKLDMTEPMAGVPWAMPALSILALLGVAAWTAANGGLRREVVAVWMAVLPTAIAMFAAVAVSHRYTTDFVPFLITAGALGVAVIDRWSGAWGRLWRTIVVLACALSIAITVALTLSFQGEGVWGVPDETQQHFRELRTRVDSFFGVKR